MKARARQRKHSIKGAAITGPLTKDDANVRKALGRTGRRGSFFGTFPARHVVILQSTFLDWTPCFHSYGTGFSFPRIALPFHDSMLTAASALPAARFGFRTAVASGNLFVLGGYDHRSQPTATVWRFAQPVAVPRNT